MLEQSFTANNLTAFDDNGVPGVALGEIVGEETRHYLLLLRSKPNGKADEAEALYAEWDEQSNACVNGIESVTLNENQLRVVFTDEAGIVNSDDGQPLLLLTALFETDSETLQTIDAGLQRLTADLCRYQNGK